MLIKTMKHWQKLLSIFIFFQHQQHWIKILLNNIYLFLIRNHPSYEGLHQLILIGHAVEAI